MTLIEALRYLHETARLRLSAAQSDVVFGTPPEVVTVSAAPQGTTRILYPDPPLRREELVWVKNARPPLDLVTPLESRAGLDAPSGFPLVGLSLSGSPDARTADRSGSKPLSGQPRDAGRGPCACQKPCNGYATCAYSWISPPCHLPLQHRKLVAQQSR
jgi:hypothetical protein